MAMALSQALLDIVANNQYWIKLIDVSGETIRFRLDDRNLEIANRMARSLIKVRAKPMASNNPFHLLRKLCFKLLMYSASSSGMKFPIAASHEERQVLCNLMDRLIELERQHQELMHVINEHIKVMSGIKVSLCLQQHKREHTVPMHIFSLYNQHSFQGKEQIEFFFSNENDMASCVGVGLPSSKNIQLVMDCNTVESTKEKFADKCRSFVGSGEEMSQLYGVGLDGMSACTHDTTYNHEDGEVVLVPFLYKIALSMMTELCHKQCNNGQDGDKTDHTAQGMVEGKGKASDLMKKLSNRCSSGLANANNEQGDDGDEDGNGDKEKHNNESTTYAKEEDDLMESLKVTVCPLPKTHFYKPGGYTRVSCWEGLCGATIDLEMVFIFYKGKVEKEIAIKTTSTLQLDTDRAVSKDPNRFGWYHHDIGISLGCIPKFGAAHGAATLKLNSYKISSSVSTTATCKRIRAGSTSVLAGSSATVAGELGLPLCKLSMNGLLRAQATTSRDHSSEASVDTICKGFFIQDSSSRQSPACAKFSLLYPMDKTEAMWESKRFHETQGLCSTIEPCIEGVWCPQDTSENSPYKLFIIRDLTLHKLKGSGKVEDLVCNQDHVVLFYVNHAMTHILRKEGQDIRMRSQPGHDVQVLNVLEVVDIQEGRASAASTFLACPSSPGVGDQG